MTFKQFFKYQTLTSLIWTGISVILSVITFFGTKALVEAYNKNESEDSES